MGSRLPLLALLTSVCVTLGCKSEAAQVGRGSGTLRVIASAEAEPDPAGADAVVTTFSVQLWKATAPVPDALVRVSSSLGDLQLDDQFHSGSYRATQMGYAHTYTFSARLGADFVEDATLTGPDAPTFSAPAKGATVERESPLHVAWSPAGADEAAIRTMGFPTLTIPDTGSFDLPKESLRWVSPGMSAEDEIRVRRGNTARLGGATPDSGIGVSVSDDLPVTVVAVLGP
jgi:hypothetical protein